MSRRSSPMLGKILHLRISAYFLHFPLLLDPRLAGRLVTVLMRTHATPRGLRARPLPPIKSSTSRRTQVQTKAAFRWRLLRTTIVPFQMLPRLSSQEALLVPRFRLTVRGQPAVRQSLGARRRHRAA
ncbi:hypothetical protein EDB92DRAFT_1487330 [Lactarius akahatsu]|uniref:Uncharacterized protein n=1 Tax=Lactarius akahatsu TaxID=416441 RepID=A0AAD4L8G8_9AGAM|nr:hypothetical protein EDB92DRAFT_1487330 [Lactarius akahatsu]